jgi:signal transduction histidine kinase
MMFKNLRFYLTLLYSISVLILVVLIGGCTYALLEYYFQINTDFALQYRVAKEFTTQGFPLPDDLATIEQNWDRNGDQLLPNLFIPPGWRKANPNATGKGNGFLEDAYDGELAAIFINWLDSDGELLQSSISNSPFFTPDINAVQTALANGLDQRTVLLDDGTSVRLLTYHITFANHSSFIQAGRSLSDQQHILTQLLVGLLALGAISAIMIGVYSWWLAGRSILPAQVAWEKQQSFISNASHELRSPITLIRASAEVALRKTSLKDSRYELLSDILGECDQVAQLIKDLLILSQLDSGSVKHVREKVSPAELFKDVCRHFTQTLEEHGIKLEIGQTRGTAWGNAARLRQVLLILMDNASRHTPSGGVIHLEAYPQGNQVLFIIKDTGSGIAPEHLPHIFERFYAANNSRSNENQSNGLGLSIALAIMEAQNGKIKVESQVGIGTRVILMLPKH